jgi:hypothetical protein
MLSWRARLAELGPVESFDYPYMAAGKKRPDPSARLLASHAEALASARERHGDAVVLVGKSLGGRMSCHLALAERVLGVVCLGFPLRGARPSAPLRDAVLRGLERPLCLVQGTSDPLCPLELLGPVLAERRAPTQLEVVEDGDHSLLVKKRALARAGLTQAAVDARVLDALARFVAPLGLSAPRARRACRTRGPTGGSRRRSATPGP